MTLEDAFWEVSTPGSNKYLQYRSVSDIASIIGSSSADISAVSLWLGSAGGSSIEVSPLRDAVSAVFFSGSHHFTLGAHGVPIKDERRPAAVRFLVRRDAASAASAAQEPRRPHGASSVSNPTVEEIKGAYGIPVDFAATNSLTTNMVWGPGTFGYSPKDLEAFAKQREFPRACCYCGCVWG